MADASSPSRFPIQFHPSNALMGYDRAKGRMDHSLDHNVTLSAIPQDDGGTSWEAKTSDGKMLPVFRLVAVAKGAGFPLIVQDAAGVCWVCYEDEIHQQSTCYRAECVTF